MTGFLSGTTQPISRMTVRALVDLGYGGVDVSKADAFSIASTGRRRRRRLRGGSADEDDDETSPSTLKKPFHMGDDLYKGPVHYFDDAVPKPGRDAEFRESVKAAKRRRGDRRPKGSQGQ